MPIQQQNVRVTLEENPNLKVTARTREHLGVTATCSDIVQARLLGIPGEDGTDGIDGQDGSGAVQINESALASETKILDQSNLAVVDSVKWLITTTDTAGLRKQVVEVLGLHNTTTVTHTVYGRIGDKISIKFNVIITGAYMELQVTNNEVVALDFRILKFSTNA